jgi:hypothetical protein
MLGLRLAEGLNLEQAASELCTELWTPERSRARDRLLGQGKLKIDGGQVSIPKSQWLLADGIIASLM